MPSKKSDQTAFEDTVRRILKAGPLPNSKAKPKSKAATRVRPKVTN